MFVVCRLPRYFHIYTHTHTYKLQLPRWSLRKKIRHSTHTDLSLMNLISFFVFLHIFFFSHSMSNFNLLMSHFFQNTENSSSNAQIIMILVKRKKKKSIHLLVSIDFSLNFNCLVMPPGKEIQTLDSQMNIFN